MNALRIHGFRRIAAPALLFACVFGGCSGEDSPRPPRQTDRPNFLWIIWDTVRADHLSLYGHSRPTTPKLDAWAEGARVYDNAVSVAGYTLPSHASMFTGMLPSQHCTNNDNKRLSLEYKTLAELLSETGYETYLYSANPNLSPGRQLNQGFDLSEYPWSERYRAEAERIVVSKSAKEDSSSTLARKAHLAAAGKTTLTPWNIKASGELAEIALLNWLGSTDPNRPFFAFLNYMEAHRPVIPTREARERLMDEEEIARSYKVDRSWTPMWEYTFGLRQYTPDEMELTRVTYDATLTELDDYLDSLLARLREEGYLENTVVILTADHGEHLGDQHMLDHQYTLHQAVLNIPLVIHYPARFEPGRDDSPVMNFDLFSTVLELAGVAVPLTQPVSSQSLLTPSSDRVRLSEDPSGSEAGMLQVTKAHPSWDPTPWKRKLRALYDGEYKYIWNSRGDHHLYRLSDDPHEERNLLASTEDGRVLAERYDRLLHDRYEPLVTCLPVPASPQSVEQDGELKGYLEALGYVEDDAPAPKK